MSVYYNIIKGRHAAIYKYTVLNRTQVYCEVQACIVLILGKTYYAACTQSSRGKAFSPSYSLKAIGTLLVVALQHAFAW